MAYLGFVGGGFVGNFTSLANLELVFPAQRYAGRQATVETSGVVTWYFSTGAAWTQVTATVPLAATTSTAVRLAGGAYSYADTTSWDCPDSDWCFVVIEKSTAIGTTGVYKSALSTGALGAQSSINLAIQPPGATNPGALEARIRGDAGAALTMTSSTPYNDGLWRVVVIQRVGARVQFKTCPIMGEVVIEQDFGYSGGAITCLDTPAIGQISAQTASRNWVGSIQRFAKGSFSLTDAEIELIASGTAPTALPTRTWDIASNFLVNAATFVDVSGNGNAATRTSTSVANDSGPTFGPTVVLDTDFGTKRVFQRAISGTRPVTISGVWTGVTDDLQARTIDYATGAQVTAWADCTVNGRGGFSATHQVPSHTNWLVYEVRSKTYPEVIGRTAEKWGCGAVILLAGQSQMFNMGVYNVGQPNADDLISRFSFTGNTWAQPNGMGMRTFLNAMQATPAVLNCPVGAIMGALGGTALTSNGNEGSGYWLDRSAGSLFQRIVEQGAEWGNDFEAIAWNQGGSDARQAVAGSAMYSGMTTMYNDWLSQTGRTRAQLPFIMTGLYRIESSVLDLDSVAPRYFAVRSALQQWAIDTTGVVDAGSTVDLPVPNDAPANTGLHWNEAGQQRFARRLAQTWLKILGNQTYTGAGPKLTGTATRAGAVLTLPITHNGGSALQVPGGSNCNYFDVSVNSTFTPLLTVSSTSVAAGNAVTVTLSADPGVPVYIRYGWGALPGGASFPTDLQRPIYDTVNIQGDTGGAPLQPTIVSIVSST